MYSSGLVHRRGSEVADLLIVGSWCRCRVFGGRLADRSEPGVDLFGGYRANPPRRLRSGYAMPLDPSAIGMREEVIT